MKNLIAAVEMLQEAADACEGGRVRISYDDIALGPGAPTNWSAEALWRFMTEPFRKGPFSCVDDLARSMMDEGGGRPLVSHGKMPNTEAEGSVALFRLDEAGRLRISGHWENLETPPPCPDIELGILPDERAVFVNWSARADERMFVGRLLAVFCVMYGHEMYEPEGE